MGLKSRSNAWVSASAIGRAEFCPKYLEHQNRGAVVSEQAIAKRKHGEIGHDHLNERVSDTRCFVASHLYGENDVRTQTLRNFRDNSLMPHLHGRILVKAYYRLSPAFVRLSRTFPILNKASHVIVNQVVDYVKGIE